MSRNYNVIATFRLEMPVNQPMCTANQSLLQNCHRAILVKFWEGLKVMRIANAIAEHVHLPANEPALICSDEAIKQVFHYWRGATSRRYLHTVYSLTQCPILPKANYILVKRDADGRRIPLRIGRTTERAGSLNLAHLRQKGAQLGANEVHIHLLTENDDERQFVELDLHAQTRSAFTSPDHSPETMMM